ncbi:MAG TPA: MmgE/PrpD family protein [Anaeromyxobacteraceae bacterium]|nr:MmgE/PrpD family protein [Anaeromyxobacteraceae bacterium]
MVAASARIGYTLEMPHIGRRTFLQVAAGSAAALGSTGGLATEAGSSAAEAPAAAPAPSGAPPARGVTRTLARFVVNGRYEDLPARVRKEAVRTLLNYVGVAVGGSRTEATELAVAALSPFSGPAQASLFGRRERLDVMNAAFVNGVSSHVFDYDDTHLKTIIHPGGPVASAILACSESRPVDGKQLLNALVLGIEACCRIGNAVYPDHYDRGWHITGTAGVFGAAAACGKLMGLTEQQMVWALGLAASQPVGFRESFGSMNKSFNPGRAAMSGMFAAILASKGFTSSEGMIEARRGWAPTISTKQDYREITEGLGQQYEAALNTYKPFACGIVLHPAIDAAIQLRNENRLTPDVIDHVELRVHPLVLELTGKKTPQVGLETKFSVYHAVAVAIVEGAAGEKQFSDRAAKSPAVLALRERVQPTVDAAVKPEQVVMTAVLEDGRRLTKRIEHAVGSLANPMTDQALEAKFTDLADGILPKPQARQLMELCWNVEKLSNAADVVRAGTSKSGGA